MYSPIKRAIHINIVVGGRLLFVTHVLHKAWVFLIDLDFFDTLSQVRVEIDNTQLA
jgi:hypothetical protein